MRRVRSENVVRAEEKLVQYGLYGSTDVRRRCRTEEVTKVANGESGDIDNRLQVEIDMPCVF